MGVSNKSIEQFNGGYSQEEEHLDILELEKQLLKEDAKEKVTQTEGDETKRSIKRQIKISKDSLTSIKYILSTEKKVETFQQRLVLFY